jgi:indoleamine 2,3-dioxygenase
VFFLFFFLVARTEIFLFFVFCFFVKLPILPITELKKSEVLLRRAHHVLGWIMHFYIHSLPPRTPIRIPPPLTLPLLQVSAQLQLPPVLTYSDDVLYNWYIPNSDEIPTHTSPLRCQTLFTSTKDEAEFYLVSARIELRGVDALELMRITMDEAFVGDDIAARRITTYLRDLAGVIRDLARILSSVKGGCDPDVFYRDVRPWFRGEDSISSSSSGEEEKRKWVFEGMEMDETLTEPTELSGPSAGQSSLIHALDAFLGVDRYSHSKEFAGSFPSTTSTQTSSKSAFLQRMQLYMPRHHRAFLTHLSNNPRPLREVVLSLTKSGEHPGLMEAYNESVRALKEFRDLHMVIVALYIVGPAKRARERERERAAAVGEGGGEGEGTRRRPLKGTGGTDLVKFLKGVRDQTEGTLLQLPGAPS